MLNKGQRVSLRPACDEWMQGDKYGEIVGYGHARQYHDSFTGDINKVRPYLVKLDKSERTRRFHPDNVISLAS